MYTYIYIAILRWLSPYCHVNGQWRNVPMIPVLRPNLSELSVGDLTNWLGNDGIWSTWIHVGLWLWNVPGTWDGSNLSQHWMVFVVEYKEHKQTSVAPLEINNHVWSDPCQIKMICPGRTCSRKCGSSIGRKWRIWRRWSNQKCGNRRGTKMGIFYLACSSYLQTYGCLYLYVYRIRRIYDIDIYYNRPCSTFLYMHMYMQCI